MQNRQSYACCADNHQQHKGQRHRQHLPEAKRAKDGEIERTCRPTLQNESIDRLFMPQTPAYRQQDNRKQRRRNQTQLKREQGVLDRIAQQERETEEEKQDPQLSQRIALHKPAHQR